MTENFNLQIVSLINTLLFVRIKGSLHTTIFWKYTELFNILEISSGVTW